ncbi:response regulator transcription factor [Acetobacterium wieringae]|uniref:Stage 0 sporulation protein A homolog n=1 Tax=Acetobacterium wieringae TaxID=52694 RepID=A0A1F2PJV9_9FIRM|nr:response regulator transcription factor [Acetobacterium wieringae]OFV71628.1 response regulator protein VraR [Acetobacterium wieringae]UYO62324.1 response regulator transcription factor [Acetobacterium wieringae]VUZ23025.1 Response regulator protein VraR [Acetobacterium wieringae]
MKILVVDDDRLVCASLKTIIEAQGDIEVIGIGHNGEEAIALYRKLKPDVLLMDIRMEVKTGLEAAAAILAIDQTARILFLTTFLDDEYIIKALKLGAKGYIIKQDFESIVPALRAVEIGQSVFGQDIVTKIPGLINQQEPRSVDYFDLSEKERELLDRVAQGLSNREIAESLYLSEGTVRNRISVILEKLNLRDRTQLAIFFYKNLN